MKMSTITMLGAAAALTINTAASAQHSYLPAQDADGKITPLVDDGVNFKFDRVVTNTFSTALADNVYRAGGPSAFTIATDDPAFPAGFTALPAQEALLITNPILSDPMFSSSGNLLYWDGEGAMPDFGAVPEFTTVTISRDDGGVLTRKAVLDGDEVEFGPWVEDISNADGSRSGHFHMRYDVVGDETDASNEAPDGIYLLGHVVGMTGQTDSDLIYVPLLKNPTDDLDLFAAFSSAITMLEAKVPVPEPTAGLILAGSAALLLIGRGRKSEPTS